MPLGGQVVSRYLQQVPCKAPGCVQYVCRRLYAITHAANVADKISSFNSITSDLAAANSAEAILAPKVYKIKSFDVRFDVVSNTTLDENLFTYEGLVTFGYFDVPAEGALPVFTGVISKTGDFFSNVHNVVLHEEDIPPIAIPYGKCFGFVISAEPVFDTTIATPGSIVCGVEVVYETNA